MVPASYFYFDKSPFCSVLSSAFAGPFVTTAPPSIFGYLSLCCLAANQDLRWALLAFGGLLIASLKDEVALKVLFISAALYFLSSYKLLTTGSSLLVWQPGWYLETMMSYSDRIGWTKFYSAMTNYRLGGQWPKAILAYGVAFGIFWVGNMGTRLIAIKRIKRLSELSWEEIFMATVIAAGLAIPMFFLQRGTPWNTIQFFLLFSLFLRDLGGSSCVSNQE